MAIYHYVTFNNLSKGPQLYLIVTAVLIWFVSQTPYLIHDNTEAPHITGCGVLLKLESLDYSKTYV